MKKALFLCIALMLCRLPIAAQTYTPTEANMASRTEFQDAKFGIFIHWGLYAMLGQGEWVMTNQNLKYDEYSKLASAFYPINFDAEAWVSAFKAAGAKYICITSRHHDGFSMFGTKQTPYNIVDATPFHRDPLKELADECEKQGLRLHFYYSTLDWYRDDYQPVGRTGRGTGRPGKGSVETYFEFMYGQITELLTNYGKVGCIWFDGHWDQDENPDGFDWHYDRLYPLIHSLQPNCMVGNNHHIVPFEGEDLQIFERDIPGENSAGWHEGGVSALPLETCQTMNNSWGYRISDNNYKTIPQLIKYLVKTAGRNANLLLNIGPQPNGELPEASLERLAGIGEWMSKNSESFYNTRSNLVPPQPWGVVTNKSDRMYLHIFPDEMRAAKIQGKIFVPITGKDGAAFSKIKSATPLGSAEKLTFKQYKEGLFVDVPEIEKDIVDYIIEVKW